MLARVRKSSPKKKSTLLSDVNDIVPSLVLKKDCDILCRQKDRGLLAAKCLGPSDRSC